MLEGYIVEVEMYAFEQEVGCYESLLVAIVEHGGIVAHTFKCGWIDIFQVFCEVVNETKLTECGNFCFRHFIDSTRCVLIIHI